MYIQCEPSVIGIFSREHMVKNDFFLRLVELFPEPGEDIAEVSFRLYAGDRVQYERRYDRAQTMARLEYARQELARYRHGSLPRILGQDHVPRQALMHEYFCLHTTEQVDRCRVTVTGGRAPASADVVVRPYESPNIHRFPMRGTFLVSDTYPSINSHRWCRNSEFAMDIGLFSRDLGTPVIAGMPVYASCAGTVEEAFDGLEDSTSQTDFDAIEALYGEPARIDGNHVLLRHQGGEYTLYSHLARGSVLVRPGQQVAAGEMLGAVGSSGSSAMPHLHFHTMLEGLHGPGVPVRFSNVVSFFGQPCPLDETTNLIRAL